MFELLFAIFSTGMPACIDDSAPREQTACVWHADGMGNYSGSSFVNWNLPTGGYVTLTKNTLTISLLAE